MEGVPLSGQMWTPAPKKGIIPLHPLTFGMLLGRAFAALRHNPKVLFGFAVVIQLVATVVTASVMGVVLFTTFSRLETVSPSSPDFEAVLAGTIGINLIAGLGVGLASIAFTAMMQGVVAAEIGYAAVGVKATLRMLWRRMAPAFWRLAGFASLSVIALFGLLAIIVTIIAAFVAGGMGGSVELIGVVVLVVLLFGLAAIPLSVWLTTKLLLVPSILVLEHARFREAFVRSWRLTRGRFWVAFGVTFLINVIMGVAAQVVSIPATLLSSLLGSVIAPTGAQDPSAVVGYVLTFLAPQILLLVIQAIALVVQSTGSTLVYLDCRMRYEGLDQTLIAYVEHRDLGRTDDELGDPFIVDPARAVTSAPPPRQVPDHVMMAQGTSYPQPYPGQPYPGQPYAPQPYGQQPYAPQPYAQQQNGTPAVPAPVAEAPGAFPPPPPPAASATATRPTPPPGPADGGWTAPGSDDAA
ncbi:MAG: hypothetical protein K0R99_1108 [Microbacterium sp.]|uniref:glycerophosphoryl diester phosphodiesterase membrane domain-containing protein n=1 Tax=Microbacterium sp. TaxID=51671 RepID=UPI002631F3ED|nr:glycerophosphoryl diester phosphodiesterase membrane domain-containing protein [Microbacterium sp.]MDF2559662.1 hypothetical protein [Microbacterium sp.]